MTSQPPLAIRQLTRRYGPRGVSTEWTLAAFEQMTRAQRRTFAEAIAASDGKQLDALTADLRDVLERCGRGELLYNLGRGAQTALERNESMTRGAHKIGERAALIAAIERVAGAVMAADKLPAPLFEALTEPFVTTFGRRP